jgi:hypothetical protein
VIFPYFKWNLWSGVGSSSSSIPYFKWNLWSGVVVVPPFEGSQLGFQMIFLIENNHGSSLKVVISNFINFM